MSDADQPAPRVEPRPPSDWDDETREVMAGLVTGPDGETLNIFATLAHHPKLLKRWLVFGTHVLGKSTLPDRDRELLILRTAWNCGSDYEWGQHVPIATGAGLTAPEVDRLARAETAGWNEADAALVQAADDLHRDARISDATWAALARRHDTMQLLDLVFTVGQYHLVAFALNSLDVQREPGVDGLPA
jgi:4-carboxymuconolactone decarboxylase